MMVTIDETRHDDMTAVTQDLVRLVTAGEILLDANLDDLAITLESSMTSARSLSMTRPMMYLPRISEDDILCGPPCRRQI
jgi:hypothetical protein